MDLLNGLKTSALMQRALSQSFTAPMPLKLSFLLGHDVTENHDVAHREVRHVVCHGGDYLNDDKIQLWNAHGA